MPPPMLGDGEVIARAWIAALVATTPLEELAGLPVAGLAREAPPLCAALVRALGSDDELALLPLMAAGAGALAGGRDAGGLASALARLRDATFTTVLEEVDRPGGDWVARLAARVAFATDRLLEAALLAGAGGAPHAVRGTSEGSGPAFEDAGTPPREALDLLIDIGEDLEEEDPALEPLPDPLLSLDPARLHVRDGAPPWERMIARAVGRHLEDGVPFAVLVVEVDGADRLMAADGGAQALERADRALGETVRARDRVVSDPPARWWALVPDAGSDDARALARRVTAAAASIEHAGAPLTVSIGVGSCPRDGTDAQVLAATADERLLGARAAGRPLGED